MEMGAWKGGKEGKGEGEDANKCNSRRALLKEISL
jgi:hypothetical protein